ncbi:TRAP transporter large permease [Candidatus Sumerlaeota bacterium]|nr:TRAP transporter large permease [Candidatus Sumerlaeota bacterium]
MIAFLFTCFLILLLWGVPISIVMILSSALAIIGFSQYSLDVIAQKLFSQSNSFPLMAVPFFVFAGGIMSKGGMSARLIRLASAMVGNVRGGLAMVSVIACMFFASISGSTAATTAAIGMVLMPAIIKTGFSPGSTTGLLASAGSIGIIIPPSIPFVLMGVIGGISIGGLFIGGILPGILIGAFLMLTAHLTARIQKHPPSGEKIRFDKIFPAFKDSILSLLTVIFIVGSIMKGIATPTEAAIIAVIWALLVCGIIYKELKMSDLSDILVQTVKITGIVVFCIAATAPFAWLMTIEQVPGRIATAMTAMTQNPALLKLMMIAILLVVGTFLDLTPALIILVPILQPIARNFGMPDIQFGMMMVMALGIGQCTPPVGISLFVACSISRIKIGDVMIPMLPYLAAMLLALLLVSFFPAISVWLPSLTMK